MKRFQERSRPVMKQVRNMAIDQALGRSLAGPGPHQEDQGLSGGFVHRPAHHIAQESHNLMSHHGSQGLERHVGSGRPAMQDPYENLHAQHPLYHMYLHHPHGVKGGFSFGDFLNKVKDVVKPIASIAGPVLQAVGGPRGKIAGTILNAVAGSAKPRLNRKRKMSVSSAEGSGQYGDTSMVGYGRSGGANGSGMFDMIPILGPVLSALTGRGGRSGGGRSGGGRSGGGKPKNNRHEIVRKVMHEKGLSMIEASKYVKAHNLY
jgi:hypothetical protein